MSEVVLMPTKEEELWGAIYMLGKNLDALSLRINDLEKAHNRLAHYVGHATEGNTIDRDMGAKNEMGGEAG